MCVTVAAKFGSWRTVSGISMVNLYRIVLKLSETNPEHMFYSGKMHRAIEVWIATSGGHFVVENSKSRHRSPEMKEVDVTLSKLIWFGSEMAQKNRNEMEITKIQKFEFAASWVPTRKSKNVEFRCPKSWNNANWSGCIRPCCPFIISKCFLTRNDDVSTVCYQLYQYVHVQQWLPTILFWPVQAMLQV